MLGEDIIGNHNGEAGSICLNTPSQIKGRKNAEEEDGRGEFVATIVP
jgi:hypothetical protein